MIKEHITVKDDLVIIKIEYKERKYANQPKLIHSGVVEHLIPDEFAGKVKLVHAPNKELSNIKSANFLLSGEWTFQILKEQPPAPTNTKSTPKRKTPSRRTTRKKTLTSKKE